MSVAAGVPARPMWGELSIVVDRPDGTQIRWAGDELDARNIPVDLAFSTSMPGGFKGLVCTLLRDLGLPGREGLFDRVRVLGPGQEVLWEGRIQQMPASTDSGGRVQPQAVGWSAHLEDDATFRRIYVDRELSGWGGRPLQRMISLAGFAQLAAADGDVGVWAQSDGAGVGPGIRLTIKGPAWSSAQGRPERGVTYQGGGLDLAEVEHRWIGSKNLGGWFLPLEGFAAADGDATTSAVYTAGSTVVAGQRRSLSMAAGTRRIDTSLRYEAYPAGSADYTYEVYLVEVAVYGRHGVPGVRGRSYVGAGQGPYGFRASDVLPDVLSSAAPLLRWTTGPGGTITPTDYPISQLVFADPTTAADVVGRLNAYHYWDWAVWEDRTFFWGPRNSGRTWSISTEDGLDLSLEGETTDAVHNGVLVQYQDFGGMSHQLGPPGSLAEATDDRLISYDESNPATIHGIRRWAVLTLSRATDREGAATIGQAWLGAQATATRRGSATVYSTVTDDQGQAHPVWRIRAGDQLVVTDRPDDPPRRIIETNYVHASRSIALTLDNSAATIDAMLERYADAFAGQT